MVSPYSPGPGTAVHGTPYRQRRAPRTAVATMPEQSLLALRLVGGLSAAIGVVALRAFMLWILH